MIKEITVDLMDKVIETQRGTRFKITGINVETQEISVGGVWYDITAFNKTYRIV